MDESTDSWAIKYAARRPPPNPRALVGSVLKCVTLIESFLGGTNDVALSELVRRTAYPPPTVHRLLATLEYAGWVTRTPGGGYQLSLHIAELARYVLAGINLREQALAPMQELTETTGETAYLVVREADHAVCVERVESHNMVRIMSWDVGSVLPLYAGGAPLALLAYTPESERARLLNAGPIEPPLGGPLTPSDVERRLRQFRKQGYSLSAEETIPGIASIGAPVFGSDAQAIAGVSVGGLSSTMLGDRLESLAEAVHAAGEQISKRMGFRKKYPIEIS